MSTTTSRRVATRINRTHKCIAAENSFVDIACAYTEKNVHIKSVLGNLVKRLIFYYDTHTRTYTIHYTTHTTIKHVDVARFDSKIYSDCNAHR